MKMHLNLATRDLDASVAFYRTLLLAEPAKRYPDYALFVTGDPGLELALDLDPATEVHEGAHYGVVVETPEAVDAAIARFTAAGYPIDVESHETCCYAEQNKVWATDPDGRRWETYFVVAESAAPEPAVREPAVRESAAPEPAVHEPAVHEPAARETAARETAVRETGVRETGAREAEPTTCCQTDAALASASPACC